MRTLTYVNNQGGTLGFNYKPPFILQDFKQDVSVDIYSSKGMNQDGEMYLGNTLDIMDLTLEVALLNSTKAELINNRSIVNKVFNPKLGEGYLIYKDEVKERKVKCIINKLPFWDETDGVVSEGLISLTANKSFWTDLLESKEEIALWVGTFEFPLELVAGGIEMGYREPSLIVNTNNTGDVECGMRIEFKALATLDTPSLLDVNTNEFIKINKEMVAGEVISVSTYFGAKKITSTLNGVTTNIFNYIDFNSTFLQLDVGDNLFRYDATTGLDNLEVTIYYNQQYLGV